MKKILSLMLSCAMIFTLLTVFTVSGFAADDISNHWAAEALGKAQSEGWLDVKEDNNFYPNQNAARQEVVYMVYSSQLNRQTKLEMNADKDISQFSDSEDFNPKYEQALKVLYANGLINGYTDGSFKPDGDITRAEAATIISQLIGEKQLTVDFYGFNDEIPDWAKINVERCARAGIVSGYSDNTFAPSNNVTRAEIVMMLIKLNEFNEVLPVSQKTHSETTKETTKETTTDEPAAEQTTDAAVENEQGDDSEENEQGDDAEDDEIPVDMQKAEELLECINNERREEGIGDVGLDDTLCGIAMQRAVEMYEKNVEDDSSPKYGTLEEHLSSEGVSYISCFQIKLKGVSRGEDVISYLERNTEDYDKMMAMNYEKIGVGFYNDRWCIIYVK